MLNGNAQRANRLFSAIKDKTAQIGVIGLGYVGLPLSITAVRAGYRVLGFDINASHVKQINRGERVINHIPAEVMADIRKEEKFQATADFQRLAEPDALLICVPTPLTRYREPDLSYVEKTAEAIARGFAEVSWSYLNRQPTRAQHRTCCAQSLRQAG